MASATTIEWTRGDDGTPGATWNPTRGCSRVSAGCTNCYAESIAARFSGPGKPYSGFAERNERGAHWTGRVELVPSALDLPLRWRRPRRVFVNSMSDLFHEALPDEDIAAVFGVMAACPQHTFQILTKRAERMREWFAWVASRTPTDPACLVRINAANVQEGGGDIGPCPLAPIFDRLYGDVEWHKQGWPWPLPNVWIGVSVEDQATADERIPHLLATPAAVRFVSYEPALGPVDFSRWLGHNPLHATNGHRGDPVPRGDSGVDRGPRGWVDLAHRTAPQEPMGRDRDGEADEASPDRRGSGSRVQVRRPDGGRQADRDAGAPARLARAPGTDPERDDDQPQERQEGGQPPREPGVGFLLGPDDACLPHGTEGRARGEEPGGEGDGRGRGVDASRVREGRYHTGGPGETVRDQFSAGVADHARRPPAETGRPDGGLRDAPRDGGKRARSAGALHLVIVGGESGPGARPFDLAWARSTIAQCRAAGVACFVKQIGSNPGPAIGATEALGGYRPRDRKGGDPSEWPADLRVREFPTVTP